jgi:hypothetical protein
MRTVFPIVPGSSGPIWMFLGMALFFAALLGAFAWFAWSSKHTTLEVTGDAVRVRGAMYGRSIPIERIRIEDAAAVQVASGENRLVTRTNGAGLPGYLAGWFRSASGERVLAFVTDKRRVAYLPTDDGYALMFSTDRPDELIAAVRAAVGNL